MRSTTFSPYLAVLAGLLFSGCPSVTDCGVYEYDPVRMSCVCLIGTLQTSDGRCVPTDAGSEPIDATGDAGLRDAPSDGCTPTTYYRDQDEDTFGDALDPIEACEAPAGYVSNNDDCDDSCAMCYPGAVETCSGVNEDCDTSTDEAPAGDACASGTCALGVCQPLPTGVTISGGWTHTCARRATGALACWGRNTFGELGNGTTSTMVTTRPVTVAGLTDVIDVAANGETTCVVDATGTVTCFGNNDQGQVGDGSTTSPHPEFSVVDLPEAAVQVTISSSTTCARLVSGALACWGSNSVGQLGNGLTAASPLPVGVLGVGDAVDLASWSAHSCVVRAAGTVSCWGWNSDGQVGDGTLVNARRPTTVGGIAGATDIAAGGRHSCALIGATNSVACWGQGTAGQLGNGASVGSRTPVVVTGLPTGAGAAITQIAAGGGHTCALTSGGAVYCWGLNDSGQVGDGSLVNRASARLVSGLSAAAEVRCGDRYTCARTTSGPVYCWGYNVDGGLGDGGTTNSSTPVLVSGL